MLWSQFTPVSYKLIIIRESLRLATRRRVRLRIGCQGQRRYINAVQRLGPATAEPGSRIAKMGRSGLWLLAVLQDALAPAFLGRWEKETWPQEFQLRQRESQIVLVQLLVAALGVFFGIVGHADHFRDGDGVQSAEGL